MGARRGDGLVVHTHTHKHTHTYTHTHTHTHTRIHTHTHTHTHIVWQPPQGALDSKMWIDQKLKVFAQSGAASSAEATDPLPDDKAGVCVYVKRDL